MNKTESEKKRRKQTIARDPVIQQKLEILRKLQAEQQSKSSSSAS